MDTPPLAESPPSKRAKTTGSLSRRMILIAAAWIGLLLVGGGFALDRVLVSAVTRNFDDQLQYVLRSLLASSEIGPDGEVLFSRDAATDPRFVEPYSGLYWQVSAPGAQVGGDAFFRSRSLWDRRLQFGGRHEDRNIHIYDSRQFPDERLRIVERDAQLPGSKVHWRFQVAQGRGTLDAQITVLRRTLVRSFALLGLGLVVLAWLQTSYGLWPLRRVREEIARMRAGQSNRIDTAMPDEVAPMVEELNALIEHNERQAEEARRHAGNLAHALKTPLTVIMNAATAQSEDLADTVIREARTMRRQVDHHLARARAVGRRGSAHSRADVWPSLESVERAVARLYRHVRIDITGPKDLQVHVERQDLDEMLGNLVENAAKYGGGSVFVTVTGQAGFVELMIEDDGVGIPEEDRIRIFDRGVRLDTGKPGTGLGLAIVRDVAEIYGGTVALEESEDLGGLLVRLRLPAAN
ncbi:histidine kinase [Sphingomonas melonis TY]|jgi:signal transduction histidine kinase|uniref:histidine kinase n=1 Tax=Sphingomonas melonis TY TaxID=621456 RepID=A0A175Y0V2_9SPHN|nr:MULTISPECIES: HAMP domain-containing sensor histidine kinase [Sphingomonas]AOW23097.1 histidine kinase [Sphingomonas melonis TY]ATI56526.1 sensor histidine kinase [Sphingomonas melonis]KZB94382.1 histidine kinase [Sphingomonas melonis TY]MBI0530030.1 sensor histidine kinase [Sphingomonas sp. TX0522]MBX8845409.1 HAMP domain-containing histidine kinase [Sphingomonas melonis]